MNTNILSDMIPDVGDENDRVRPTRIDVEKQKKKQPEPGLSPRVPVKISISLYVS